MYIISVVSCLINKYLLGMKICSYALYTHLNYVHKINFAIKSWLKLRAELRNFNKFKFFYQWLKLTDYKLIVPLKLLFVNHLLLMSLFMLIYCYQ